jgi:hypothetical protein
MRFPQWVGDMIHPKIERSFVWTGESDRDGSVGDRTVLNIERAEPFRGFSRFNRLDRDDDRSRYPL